jgi:hypothetical protein
MGWGGITSADQVAAASDAQWFLQSARASAWSGLSRAGWAYSKPYRRTAFSPVILAACSGVMKPSSPMRLIPAMASMSAD